MKQICIDLKKQYLEFDQLVSGLDTKLWQRNTPFYGWTIFDQVAHIVFFDHEALLAMENRELFNKRAKGVMEVLSSGKSLRRHTNELLGIKDPKELLDFWRDIRNRLLLKLSKMSSKDRFQWYGPDMSTLSFATGRLMETWAHSQDVFDTLGKKRTNGKGLYHIAYMGVSTFSWSFIINNMTPPEISPLVALVGPSGEVWEWGEPDAPENGAVEKVWGSAEDFCLVVTQRRNIIDTTLKCQGENTKKWLSVAQAFAGISQEPPEAGSRIIDYGKSLK